MQLQQPSGGMLPASEEITLLSSLPKPAGQPEQMNANLESEETALNAVIA